MRKVLALATALGIAACATQTIQTDVKDAQLVVTAATAIVNDVQNAGIKVPNISQIDAVLNDMNAALADLQKATASTQAKQDVQQLVADFADFAGMVANIQGMPANVAQYLSAASVLIPEVEASVGIVVNNFGAGMTPDEARHILENAH